MKIKCPGCATLLQIPDSAAGKVVKCKCGKQLRAPAKPTSASPARPQPTPQQAPSAAPLQPANPAIPGATAPANAAPSIFDELTDTDLSGIKAVQVPGKKQQRAPSTNERKALQAADQDYRKEKAASQKSYMEGAKKEILTSIGIYVLLGVLQAGFGVFFLRGSEKEAEILAMQDGGDLGIDLILTAR